MSLTGSHYQKVQPNNYTVNFTNNYFLKKHPMKIPDFAVSSQEAGFDEFLKVFNEYFKLSCRGEFLFYGASDGQPQRDDIRWTNKFILPHAAIALLTGKQLTEGDFAHVSEHQSAMEYLQTPSLKEMESQPKLLPTQESVKDGSLGIEFTEQAENAFNHYEYPSLINTLDTSAAFWIGWRQAEIFFSTQQTAHLQQQLKQAKELLKKMESYLDDEVSIVQAAVSSDNYACINDAQLPSLYLKINQFLTRNK